MEKNDPVEILCAHPFFQGNHNAKPCQARVTTLKPNTYSVCSIRTTQTIALDSDSNIAICPYHHAKFVEKKADWYGFFDN